MHTSGRHVKGSLHCSTLARFAALASLGAMLVGTVYLNADASASQLTAGRPRSSAPAISLTSYGAPSIPTNVSVGPDSASSFNAWLPNGRKLTPAGTSVEVGENPLGEALTPDGKYLIVTNDDERNPGSLNTYSAVNGAGKVRGGYTLAIIDTATMSITGVVTPTVNAAPNPGLAANGKTQNDKNAALFLGVAAFKGSNGHYTVYAAGGTADVVYRVDLDPSVLNATTPAAIQVTQ
jgi:hypothetical protein